MKPVLQRKPKARRNFLSGSGPMLAALLVIAAPVAAWGQEQGPPGTADSERWSQLGWLQHRLWHTSFSHTLAVLNCDRAGAQAQLVELQNLAEEARRTAQAAREAGNLSTIDAEDAEEVYEHALRLYRSAREIEDCEEERRRSLQPGGAVPPAAPRPPIENVLDDMEITEEQILGPVVGRRPQTGAEPADQNPPIENVIDDMEISQEQILGPVVGRVARTGEDAAGEAPLPEIGPPLEDESVPRFTIAPGVSSGSSSVGSAVDQAGTQGAVGESRAEPVPANRLDLERWRWLLGRWKIPGGGAIQFQAAGDGTVSGVLVEGSDRLAREGYQPGQLVLRGWRYGGSNGSVWKFWANEGETFSAAKPGACCGSPLMKARWQKGGIISIKRGEDSLDIPRGRLTNYQKLSRK